MTYWPTAETARRARDEGLYDTIQRTCIEQDDSLVIPAGYRQPNTLATMVRVALTAAEEHPEIAGEQAAGLKSLVMVKVKMREWLVEVVPKPRQRRIGMAYAKATMQRSAAATVSCQGKDLTIPHPDVIWLLDRLREGSREFTNFVTETSQEEWQERLDQLGYSIGLWEPPEKVVLAAK